MFDIDKSLNEIQIIDVSPSTDLINDTKRKCRQNLKEYKDTRERGSRFSKFAIPFVAVLLIGVMIGASIPFLASNTVQAATGFYTVDINPSICVFVDDDDIVTELVFQNDDARELKDKIDCIGLHVIPAIQQIVSVADEAGYIQSDEAYVLVGYFGDSSEIEINSLQNELESSMGDMINLLVVTGTIDDKKAADNLDVSAGLLLLSRMVDGIDVTGNKKVTEIVKDLENSGETDVIEDIGYDESTHPATDISASISGSNVNLSWSKIDATDFDGYKVMYSFTDTTPVYGESGCYYAEFVTNASTTSRSYDMTKLKGYEKGATCYFSITALYSGHTILRTGDTATLVLTPETTPQPDPDPDPPTPTTSRSTTITGYMDGDIVNLSWDKITADGLEGYKVMYSFSDSTPVYGESGCYYAQWITNAGTTSGSYNVTKFKGYEPKVTCYFSITALYNGHSEKEPGNTIALTMPSTVVVDPPRTATTISGTLDGNTINLSWDEIDKSVYTDFEGYKVVYSFVNSNPSYGAQDCHYVEWITDSTRTSGSYDITALEDYSSGATCYFTITALYDSHSVRKTGNVISKIAP